MTSIEYGRREMKTVTVTLDAMSEEHARRMAMIIAGGTMEHVVDVSILSKPREATTCKTDDYPVSGTRKWKTVYQVYAYGARILKAPGQYEYLNMEIVRDDIEQKTEALKIAKAMAVKHQLPMTIQIAQKLSTHSPACADVMPKSSTGRYRVTVLVTGEEDMV